MQEMQEGAAGTIQERNRRMLKVYDQNRKFIGHISKYKDLCIEKDLSSGDRTAVFTYCRKKTRIQNEGYIQTEEDWFVVKEIGVSSDGFPEIHCQLDLEDLEAYTIANFVADKTDLASAAQAAITGTGWTVETDIQKIRSVAVIRADPLKILKKIRDAWMCEIEFDTKKKVVRFKEQIGENRGVYLLSQLNLKKVACTTDTYDFYTRIIPYGKDGLQIKDINDGKEYVENYQYSNKIRTLVWEDTSYEDAKALKEDATAKLKDLSKPKRSYTAEIRDLAKMSKKYGLLSFGIGDTVRIIDEATGIRDKQRIVKIKEYPQNPEKNTCELSNTALTFEEYQSRLQAAADAFDTITNKDGTVNGVYVKGVRAGDVVGIEVTINGSSAVKKLNGQVSSLEGGVNSLGGEIQSTNTQLEQVKTDSAAFEKLTTGKFDAVNGKIENLEAGYGEINTLVNGNLTSDNIHSLTLTSKNTTIENGMIKNAMIESLTFDKISGVDIDTSKFRIHSTDGLSVWEGNTIQISDTKKRIRVQIGKDGSGDYTLAVWDNTGKLIWDALGATEDTIQRKIIRDAIIADDAAIDGKKLNIVSVVKAVNGSQEKLSSTIINVDAKNQTLSAVLSTMETTMGENLDAAKLYSDGQLSEAQKYALGKANEALNSAKGYSDGQLSAAQKYASDRASEALSSAKGYADEQIGATEEKVTGITEITTAHSTDIKTMQGQISSLMTEDTQIKGDYNALISRYSLLEQNVGEISTKVGEHTSLIDGTEKRVTDAESTIKQQAETIEQKVSKGNVISVINQTPETVKIDASKIELSGYVTFKNALTPGEVVIDGGNLKAGTVTADKIDVTDLFAQTITATGTISGLELHCKKGEIGGFLIEERKLSCDTTISGTKYSAWLEKNSGNAADYFLGVHVGGTAKCYLRYNGEFYAQDAKVTGDITATTLRAYDKVIVYDSVRGVNHTALTAFYTSEASGVMLGSESEGTEIRCPSTFWAYGNITSNGAIEAGTDFNVSGDHGFVNTNHGGGIYMIDDSWIRTYGNKNFYCDQTIRAHKGLQAEGFDDGGGQFRAAYGNYGVMFRNDGASAYLLITNSGDPYGSWRTTWPFTMDLATGSVSMSTGQQLKGGTYIYSSSGNKRMIFNSNDRLIPTAASGSSSPNTVDLGSSDNYFKTLYYGSSLTKKSDKRDKNDLGELPGAEAVLLLRHFRAKKFSYKSDPTGVIQYGGYAQDVRDTLIETGIGYRSIIDISVKATEEATQELQYPENLVTYGLDYTQFVAPLIVGWQLHDTTLETLGRRAIELQEEINRVYIEIARIKDRIGAA